MGVRSAPAELGVRHEALFSFERRRVDLYRAILSVMLRRDMP